MQFLLLLTALLLVGGCPRAPYQVEAVYCDADWKSIQE